MQIRYDDMKIWLKEYKNPPLFGKIELKEQNTEKGTSIKFETDKIKIELRSGYNKELLQQMMEVIVQC